MIWWLYEADGWGTREKAIPGEWALLLLIIVLGAVLGLVVLWFTLLRHEKTVRRRDRRRTELLLADDVGPAASEAPEEVDAPRPAGSANGQRKLTDEILSRVEAELAERDAPRWKELAALVHHEFGVTVHPSSIQKAVKRRRPAEATELS